LPRSTVPLRYVIRTVSLPTLFLFPCARLPVIYHCPWIPGVVQHTYHRYLRYTCVPGHYNTAVCDLFIAGLHVAVPLVYIYLTHYHRWRTRPAFVQHVTIPLRYSTLTYIVYDAHCYCCCYGLRYDYLYTHSNLIRRVTYIPSYIRLIVVVLRIYTLRIWLRTRCLTARTAHTVCCCVACVAGYIAGSARCPFLFPLRFILHSLRLWIAIYSRSCYVCDDVTALPLYITLPPRVVLPCYRVPALLPCCYGLRCWFVVVVRWTTHAFILAGCCTRLPHRLTLPRLPVVRWRAHGCYICTRPRWFTLRLRSRLYACDCVVVLRLGYARVTRIVVVMIVTVVHTSYWCALYLPAYASPRCVTLQRELPLPFQLITPAYVIALLLLRDTDIAPHAAGIYCPLHCCQRCCSVTHTAYLTTLRCTHLFHAWIAHLLLPLPAVVPRCLLFTLLPLRLLRYRSHLLLWFQYLPCCAHILYRVRWLLYCYLASCYVDSITR